MVFLVAVFLATFLALVFLAAFLTATFFELVGLVTFLAAFFLGARLSAARSRGLGFAAGGLFVVEAEGLVACLAGADSIATSRGWKVPCAAFGVAFDFGSVTLS